MRLVRPRSDAFQSDSGLSCESLDTYYDLGQRDLDPGEWQTVIVGLGLDKYFRSGVGPSFVGLLRCTENP
jgi:hypothetical protein